MEKIKNIVITVTFAALLLIGFLFCAFGPKEAFSEAERRPLAQMPAVSLASVLDGSFTKDFETYATEQFPFRDAFRTGKALFATEVFRKLDNNGLFAAEGHISKIDDPENDAMMAHAAERFAFIRKTYLEGKNCKQYFAIVPDKNMFLAGKNGYPALDYQGFAERMQEKVSEMTYIDVTPFLELSDYYTTDTHWRQEKIVDIAEYIGEAMDTPCAAGYTIKTLENPFRGVYVGQIALPVSPDTILYLTNEALENVKVTYYDTGAPVEGALYNMEKAFGKDPYEMFLSGAAPIVTIENPAAGTEKELVMFRDSFASSLAPLLSAGYAKITLVDIRYIQSNFVGSFVEFENADVLFIYSTTLLNNSLALQ